jgi:hypothetical protein
MLPEEMYRHLLTREGRENKVGNLARNRPRHVQRERHPLVLLQRITEHRLLVVASATGRAFGASWQHWAAPSVSFIRFVTARTGDFARTGPM